MRRNENRMKLETLALVLAFGTGCAPMHAGPPVVTDVPRASEDRSVVTTAHLGAVAQEGQRATVTVASLCDDERIEVVQRTTERRSQNGAPQNDVWAAIGGAVLAGTGATMVARPSAFASDTADESSKLSPKETRGVGYAFVGAGAVLLAIPVIDWLRSGRVVAHTVQRVEQPAKEIRRGRPCGSPPAGTPAFVTLRTGKSFDLGRTSSEGKISVDLDDVIPAGEPFERGDTVRVRSETSELGVLGLAPLYAAREDASWRALVASACLDAASASACSGEQAYLDRFAGGEHGAEARARIDAARSREHAATEALAWEGLDLDACRKPSASEIGLAANACWPLEQFVAQFPGSTHLDVVNDALDKGRVAREQLAERDATLAEPARLISYSTPTSNTVAYGDRFIPYAGNGGGPTQCADGMLSHSSGRGTCSHHGGIAGGGSHRSPSHGATHRSPSHRSPSYGSSHRSRRR